MIIDCQCHYLSTPYLQALDGRSGYPTLEQLNGTPYLVTAPGLGFPITGTMTDIETKLRMMDANGIDVGLLSVNVPGTCRFEAELGIRLARQENDALAKVVTARPDRFLALAELPLQDVDQAILELDRSINELGFKGVSLFSNINGRPLDDPAFLPFYDRVRELRVPLFLHPTYPLGGEHMQDYELIQVIGFLMDTSLAMCRLIFSGILEGYPEITFVLPHLGSVLPYVMGRIDTSSGNIQGSRANIREAPSHYFRNVYVDTVSLHPPALKLAHEFQGVDKILFATDYPFWSVERAIQSIEKLDIPNEDKEKIFHKNAERLLQLT
ncbi:MAG: amidohydrolase family protein [Nitrospinota bacterium]